MDHSRYFGQLDHLQNLPKMGYDQMRSSITSMNQVDNYPDAVMHKMDEQLDKIESTPVVGSFMEKSKQARQFSKKLSPSESSPLRNYPLKNWIIIITMAVINFFTIFISRSRENVIVTLVQTIVASCLFYKESLKPDVNEDVDHSKWYVFVFNMLFSLVTSIYFVYQRGLALNLLNANSTVSILYMSMLLIMASVYSHIFLSIPEGMEETEYLRKKDSIKEMRSVWFGEDTGVINKIYLVVLMYITIMLTKYYYGEDIVNFLKAFAYGEQAVQAAAPIVQAAV